MHPGGLLSHREAEFGVGQDKPVFRASSREEQVIDIEAAETMGTQHSSPESRICADTNVEVTEDNQFIRH
ncbi:hypothetical protein SprV_0200755800 [Sparganum proliferum]